MGHRFQILLEWNLHLGRNEKKKRGKEKKERKHEVIKRKKGKRHKTEEKRKVKKKKGKKRKRIKERKK